MLHPILGVGPIGWIAAPVLVASIMLWLFEVDVYTPVLMGIHSVWGPGAVNAAGYWYLRVAMSWAYFVPFPSLWLLLLLFPAIRLSPRRAWRRVLIVLLALNAFSFLINLELSRHLTPLLPEANNVYWKSPYDALMNIQTWIIAEQLLLAVMAALFTRRLLVGLVMALPIVLYALPMWFRIGFDIRMWEAGTFVLTENGTLETAIWHAGVVGLFLFDAIRERRKLRNAQNCWHCNYDLANTAPSEPCPECGHAIPEEHPRWRSDERE